MKKKIDLEKYQKFVKKIAKKFEKRNEEIMTWGLGISGEAGDVASCIKKTFAHGNDQKSGIRENVGDTFWYMAAICNFFGWDIEEIIGESPALKGILEQLQTAAPTDSTILILGETGTGKELIARTLHYTSRFHERPFVALNCAAIPETLIESELFGHAPGGAERLRRGEQSILLVNRRGFSTAVFCRQCGGTLECPNCSVSLTVHRAERRARCHYCNYGVPVPATCPQCAGPYLEQAGFGTERVEAEVGRHVPGARVGRLDVADLVPNSKLRRRGLGLRRLVVAGLAKADGHVHEIGADLLLELF